ncbi:MAG: DUF4136 domain-containing protein [Acidobacteriota bacterium]
MKLSSSRFIAFNFANARMHTSREAWLKNLTDRLPESRFHLKKIVFLAATVLFVFPFVVQAQSVKVVYDETRDFTKFKTYAWGKGSPANNPQIHKLVVNEIDRQLQSRGLKKVEANADLKVIYYASLDGYINEGAVEYMKNSDWQKWGEHEPVYGPKMVALLIARMVLDLVDVSTNTLVWRGRAKDAYTPNQARGKKRVNKALAKLFAKLPPLSAT